MTAQTQPRDPASPAGFDRSFRGEDLDTCQQALEPARAVLDEAVVREAVAELVETLASTPHVRQAGIARHRIVDYVEGVALVKAITGILNRRPEPALLRSPYPLGRAGLDNPDNVYRTAALDGAAGYVIEGERNSSYDVYFQLMDGQPGEDGSLHETLGLLTGADLRPDAQGRFRITIDARDAAEVDGPHLSLPSGRSMLIFRDTLNDWANEIPVALRLRQVSGPTRTAPAAPLAEETAARTRDAVEFWNTYTARIFALPGQTVLDPAPSVGGLPGQVSAYGRFELPPGHALELTVEHCGAPYLGLQLGDALFVSTDYWDHSSSRNLTQSVVGDDGFVRYVIAPDDPGVANWIDTAGETSGLIFLRWQGIAEGVLPRPVGVRMLPVADVRSESALPAVDPVERERERRTRRRHFDRRGMAPA